MAESSLQVDMVGNLLVHYKLGKHGAVRVSNSIGTKANIEKFLKKNKAVLVRGTGSATAKKPDGVKKTAGLKNRLPSGRNNPQPADLAQSRRTRLFQGGQVLRLSNA